MTEEEEKSLQSSNACWIRKNKNKKISNHCHITGKFRAAAHLICTINFQLT